MNCSFTVFCIKEYDNDDDDDDDDDDEFGGVAPWPLSGSATAVLCCY